MDFMSNAVVTIDAECFLKRQGLFVVDRINTHKRRLLKTKPPILLCGDGNLNQYIVTVRAVFDKTSIPLNGFGKSKSERALAEYVRSIVKEGTFKIIGSSPINYEVVYIGYDGCVSTCYHRISNVAL